MAIKPYNRPNGGSCPWLDNGSPACDNASVGKSRYCIIHRPAAKKLYIARIREQVERHESQRLENDATLAAAELAGETAERSQPTPKDCILWLRNGQGSLQSYLKAHASFEKASVAARGIERQVSSLSYALAFQTSLVDAGEDCRVIL